MSHSQRFKFKIPLDRPHAPRHSNSRMSQKPFGKQKKSPKSGIPREKDAAWRKQYRSQIVNTDFLSLVAAGLILTPVAVIVGVTSCSKPEVAQTCVDPSGLVVADENCDNQVTPTPGNSSSHYGGGGHSGGYRWHYGGQNYDRGSRVEGGSYDSPSGKSLFRPNSPVTRGIFGSSSRGFFFGG